MSFLHIPTCTVEADLDLRDNPPIISGGDEYSNPRTTQVGSRLALIAAFKRSQWPFARRPSRPQPKASWRRTGSFNAVERRRARNVPVLRGRPCVARPAVFGRSRPSGNVEC